MKLGIMQPYFLPYIGYWQLLNAVDTYVIYDDVTFIKSGWIHRNRINVHGTAQFINVQMQGASSFSRICDIRVNPDLRWREKLLQTIAMAYRKAPHYTEIIPLAENIIMCGEEKLGDFLAHSLHIVAQYLQIDTHMVRSSAWAENHILHGEERVLDICRQFQATEYYNSIGGQELYDKTTFAENGIELHFLRSHEIVYPQRKNAVLSGLSILDVLMENSVLKTRELLLCYRLL